MTDFGITDANNMGAAMAPAAAATIKRFFEDTCTVPDNYDLILTMEKRHIERLCEMAPEMRGKVMLFGHWDNECEIPDPYRKSRETFAAVYTLLERSARQWAQALNAEQV